LRKREGIDTESVEHQQKSAWTVALIESPCVIAGVACEDVCTNEVSEHKNTWLIIGNLACVVIEGTVFNAPQEQPVNLQPAGWILAHLYSV